MVEERESSHRRREDFYLRYYVGHKGKFGHEFLEFEFKGDGRLRYANNSQYKAENLIRKEVYVNEIILDELKRIIEESEILKENDKTWPAPNVVGRQELEIVLGDKRSMIATSKFGSYGEVQSSSDPQGLTVFWYLVQDIKCFVLSLVNAHFRLKPV